MGAVNYLGLLIWILMAAGVTAQAKESAVSPVSLQPQRILLKNGSLTGTLAGAEIRPQLQGIQLKQGKFLITNAQDLQVHIQGFTFVVDGDFLVEVRKHPAPQWTVVQLAGKMRSLQESLAYLGQKPGLKYTLDFSLKIPQALPVSFSRLEFVNFMLELGFTHSQVLATYEEISESWLKESKQLAADFSALSEHQAQEYALELQRRERLKAQRLRESAQLRDMYRQRIWGDLHSSEAGRGLAF